MKRTRLLFILRTRVGRAIGRANKVRWRLLGMTIGRGASVGRIVSLWPHQVSIGARANVGDGVAFDYCYGEWRPGPSIVVGDRTFIGRNVQLNVRDRVTIGRDCLIAAGCQLVDHDHGVALGRPMNEQEGPEAAIELGDDVWLGANVVVMKGVRIGSGAIVGAGAVVTKDVPPLEVWAGVPARRIGTRGDAGRMQASVAV